MAPWQLAELFLCLSARGRGKIFLPGNIARGAKYRGTRVRCGNDSWRTESWHERLLLPNSLKNRHTVPTRAKSAIISGRVSSAVLGQLREIGQISLKTMRYCFPLNGTYRIDQCYLNQDACVQDLLYQSINFNHKDIHIFI